MGKKQAIKIYKVPLAHIDNDGNLKSDAKLYGYYSGFYDNDSTYPMGEKLAYSNAKNRHQGRKYDIYDARTDVLHQGIPVDKRGWSAFAYASKPDREDNLFDDWDHSSLYRKDHEQEPVDTYDAETGEHHFERVNSADIHDLNADQDAAAINVLDRVDKQKNKLRILPKTYSENKDALDRAKELKHKYYDQNYIRNNMDELDEEDEDGNVDWYSVPKEQESPDSGFFMLYAVTHPEIWSNQDAYNEYKKIMDDFKKGAYKNKDMHELSTFLHGAYDIYRNDIEDSKDNAFANIPILVEFDDDDIIRADDVLKNGYDPGRDFAQEVQLRNIINKQMIPNDRFRNVVRAYRGLQDRNWYGDVAHNLPEVMNDIQKYFDYDNPMVLSDENWKTIVSDIADDVRNERRKETTKNIAGLLKPKYGI